jgi:hypothetical protein
MDFFEPPLASPFTAFLLRFLGSFLFSTTVTASLHSYLQNFLLDCFHHMPLGIILFPLRGLESGYIKARPVNRSVEGTLDI